MNKVILIGNVTREVDLKYTQNGAPVAILGLALNKTWYDRQSNQKKEKTTFVNVTLWGKTAEIAGEYVTKGQKVAIDGELDLDEWEDKETGKRRSMLKVTGKTLHMLGGGHRSQGSGETGQSPADSFYEEPF